MPGSGKSTHFGWFKDDQHDPHPGHASRRLASLQPADLTPRKRKQSPAHAPKAPAKLADEALVLATVARLQVAPRRVVNGGGTLQLPGPNVTDIARGCGHADYHVSPVLRALAERGALTLVMLGKYRCYRLAETPLAAQAPASGTNVAQAAPGSPEATNVAQRGAQAVA